MGSGRGSIRELILNDFEVSATLGLGSVCYLMVLVCLPGMREKCTEAGHL